LLLWTPRRSNGLPQRRLSGRKIGALDLPAVNAAAAAKRGIS